MTTITEEHEDYQRRLAERQAAQERLHAAHPRKHPFYVPVDDDEFPDESFTAGWSQERGA